MGEWGKPGDGPDGLGQTAVARGQWVRNVSEDQKEGARAAEEGRKEVHSVTPEYGVVDGPAADGNGPLDKVVLGAVFVWPNHLLDVVAAARSDDGL